MNHVILNFMKLVVVINNGEPDKCGNTSSEIGYIYEKRFGGKDNE